jgi:hypothetical protein
LYAVTSQVRWPEREVAVGDVVGPEVSNVRDRRHGVVVTGCQDVQRM